MVAQMVRFRGRGYKDASGHEWVFPVGRVENQVPFKAEAKLHATRMEMEIRPASNCEEVAETQYGNAVNTIGLQVKDTIARLVAI